MNAHRACDDFHRSSERRSALTRREVLAWGAGGGLSLYLSRAMPIQRVLELAEAEAAAAPNAPILVTLAFATDGDRTRVEVAQADASSSTCRACASWSRTRGSEVPPSETFDSSHEPSSSSS